MSTQRTLIIKSAKDIHSRTIKSQIKRFLKRGNKKLSAIKLVLDFHPTDTKAIELQQTFEEIKQKSLAEFKQNIEIPKNY